MTQIVYRPEPRFQLKNDPDHPFGSSQGGSNCAATVGAMLLDRMTRGKKRTTGAAVRELTHVTGPLRPDQVDAALNRGWGIDVTTGLYTEAEIWEMLREGRGVSYVGSYAPVADSGTHYSGQEHGFRGLHQFYGNEIDADATHILVFDPLDDARRPTIPHAPIWYPKSLVLRTWREYRDDGKVWGSFTNVGFIDVPAGVTLRFGGTATFRGKWVTIRPTNLRSSPTLAHGTANIIRSVPKGLKFHNSQTTHGSEINGEDRWLGDATGKVWLPYARLKRA